MRLSNVLPLAAIAVFGACAALGMGAEPERSAQLRLDRGLDALGSGRYAAAFDDLAWVYVHCPDRQAGDDALAGLAALELDPRNPEARPAIGAELLGRLIQGTPDRAARSLAETTFLASLALGAPHPEDPIPGAADPRLPGADTAAAGSDTVAAVGVDLPADSGALASPTDVEVAAMLTPSEDIARGCGRVLASAPDPDRALPHLTGPSLARLLGSAELTRDSLALRVDSLNAVLAATQEQLTATREELERIRKTLKP